MMASSIEAHLCHQQKKMAQTWPTVCYWAGDKTLVNLIRHRIWILHAIPAHNISRPGDAIYLAISSYI